MSKPRRNLVHLNFLRFVGTVAESVAHAHRNRIDIPNMLPPGNAFTTYLGNPLMTLRIPAVSHALATTTMSDEDVLSLLANLMERADDQFRAHMRRDLLRICDGAMRSEPLSVGLKNALQRAIEAEKASREAHAVSEPQTIPDYIAAVTGEQHEAPTLFGWPEALERYADSTLRRLFEEAKAYDATAKTSIMQRIVNLELLNCRFKDPYLEAIRQILDRCHHEWPTEYPAPSVELPITTM